MNFINSRLREVRAGGAENDTVLSSAAIEELVASVRAETTSLIPADSDDESDDYQLAIEQPELSRAKLDELLENAKLELNLIKDDTLINNENNEQTSTPNPPQ